MPVDNISEYKSFSPGLSDNQLQPKSDKELKIEGIRALTEKNEANTNAALVKTRVGEIDTTTVDTESDSRVVLDRLKSINEQFPIKSTSLIFEFDDTNDPPVVKVVDKESGEVIRELPPKELREIAKALSDIADNLNGQAHNMHEKNSLGILLNERS